jgi:hypothetical protein
MGKRRNWSHDKQSCVLDGGSYPGADCHNGGVVRWEGARPSAKTGARARPSPSTNTNTDSKAQDLLVTTTYDN